MEMAALALVPPTSCCQSYFETYVFMWLLVRHSTVLLERPLRQVRAQTVRARGLEPLADSSGRPRHLCRVCLSLWAKESSP